MLSMNCITWCWWLPVLNDVVHFFSAGVVIVQGIEISGGQGRAHRVTTIEDASGKGRGRQRSTKRRGVDSLTLQKSDHFAHRHFINSSIWCVIPSDIYTIFLSSLAFLSRNIICWVYLWLYALKTCSLQSILAKNSIWSIFLRFKQQINVWIIATNVIELYIYTDRAGKDRKSVRSTLHFCTGMGGPTFCTYWPMKFPGGS